MKHQCRQQQSPVREGKQKQAPRSAATHPDNVDIAVQRGRHERRATRAGRGGSRSRIGLPQQLRDGWAAAFAREVERRPSVFVSQLGARAGFQQRGDDLRWEGV